MPGPKRPEKRKNSEKPESAEVEFPDHLLAKVEEQYRKPIIGILQLDPRDAYDRDSDKPSRLAFGNVDIEFISREGKLIVTAVRELAE